jgi:hypothetical protein
MQKIIKGSLVVTEGSHTKARGGVRGSDRAEVQGLSTSKRDDAPDSSFNWIRLDPLSTAQGVHGPQPLNARILITCLKSRSQ